MMDDAWVLSCYWIPLAISVLPDPVPVLPGEKYPPLHSDGGIAQMLISSSISMEFLNVDLLSDLIMNIRSSMGVHFFSIHDDRRDILEIAAFKLFAQFIGIQLSEIVINLVRLT